MNTEFLIFSGIVLAIGIAVVYQVRSLHKAHDGIPEGERFQVRLLYFAAVVLTGFALVFILAMGAYFLSCVGGQCSANTLNPGKEIFDTCVKIIPPLITLVLGYYFGKSEH